MNLIDLCLVRDLLAIGIYASYLRWTLMLEVCFWLGDKPTLHIAVIPRNLNPDARLWHEWGHKLPRLIPRRLADRICARYNPWQRLHMEEWKRLRTTGELGRIRMD